MATPKNENNYLGKKKSDTISETTCGKMARKKEDNGKYKRVTNKSKKSSRDSKDVDVDVIKSQLITLGLTLREVPGDG